MLYCFLEKPSAEAWDVLLFSMSGLELPGGHGLCCPLALVPPQIFPKDLKIFQQKCPMKMALRLTYKDEIPGLTCSECMNVFQTLN